MRTRSKAAYPLHRRVALAIVPVLAALVIRLLALTLRYKDVCEPRASAAPPNTSDIWCFWHQCLLTSACRFRSFDHLTVLISQSFDGELIARTIERLGYRAARGSSSRHGAFGMLKLVRAVENGSAAVFPADGPRGPRYQLKPGAIKLAQHTGRPVGAFHALPERAWTLRSWDGFLVPKPFSRVVIAWSRTRVVAHDASETDLLQAQAELQASLERARQLAEHAVSTRIG